jgi:hypothetical protein
MAVLCLPLGACSPGGPDSQGPGEGGLAPAGSLHGDPSAADPLADPVAEEAMPELDLFAPNPQTLSPGVPPPLASPPAERPGS